MFYDAHCVISREQVDWKFTFRRELSKLVREKVLGGTQNMNKSTDGYTPFL